MNTFVVFTTLMAAACAAPQTLVQTVNEGPQTGPLTPLVGNLVATPKGLRPIELEGFSEDLNQDGFVDPIAPAAPAPIVRQIVAAPAPIQQVVAAPAPFVRQVVAAPAPIVRQVVAAPAPFVRQVVAAPAPFVKTIAPLPIAVRAAPSASVFDVRRHF
eukprot:15068.XXX_780020_780559_1 [CDS] Oithona nana genome sequencing.